MPMPIDNISEDLQPLYLSYVKRWGITPMFREQSVAEHVLRVTVIARAICFALDWITIADTCMVTGIALNHDNDEVLQGDAPGPSKTIGRGQPMFPELDIWHRIVKVADAIETGTWFVVWGNPDAYRMHPYNIAPIYDINKIRHYAPKVDGLTVVADAIWHHLIGEELWQTYKRYCKPEGKPTEILPIRPDVRRT